MLRIGNSILARLLSSSPASPIFPLHRLLLSTAAAAGPPKPSFAILEYLVETCGLTRARALKASAKLSHLKSPYKPDAVLAVLAGLGLSGADIAALVAKDPLFLCSGVDTTLGPNIVELTGLGLSRTEIACLVSLVPACFRCKSIVSNLPYYLSLFGSYENLLRLIKNNSSILRASLAKKVKPNVAFLQNCGLGACDIANLFIGTPWVIGMKPERLQAMVACAQGLGIPCGSGMFRHAMSAVRFHSEEDVAAKLDYLKKMFRWSDAEVGIVVSKVPYALVRPKNMQRRSEFLISEVGLEPAYIAHRPALLTCSLEGRLRPRYYAVKFLKENGLLKREPSYDTVVKLTEKVFMEKFICPHKEAAPHLAEDYATACRGEVPTRFRFA
jgi:mTERF domain-containing protein